MPIKVLAGSLNIRVKVDLEENTVQFAIKVEPK